MATNERPTINTILRAILEYPKPLHFEEIVSEAQERFPYYKQRIRTLVKKAIRRGMENGELLKKGNWVVAKAYRSSSKVFSEEDSESSKDSKAASSTSQSMSSEVKTTSDDGTTLGDGTSSEEEETSEEATEIGDNTQTSSSSSVGPTYDPKFRLTQKFNPLPVVKEEPKKKPGKPTTNKTAPKKKGGKLMVPKKKVKNKLNFCKKPGNRTNACLRFKKYE